MPAYAYAILTGGWLIWLTPFLRAKQSEKPAKQVDRRARWGILLVALAYALLWQGPFWGNSPPALPVHSYIVLFLLATSCSLSRCRASAAPPVIRAGLPRH